MKITVSQLRKIIREEVKKDVNTGKCPKCGAKVQLTSNGLVSYHDYKNPLGDLQNCPGSQNKPLKECINKNLSEAKFNVGDKVEEKGTDSGWWEILELIPDNRTGKTVAKLKMFSPAGGRTSIAHVTTDKLGKVRESLSHRGSSPLKDGWLVNRDTGEILDMDSVPPQYVDFVEIDEEGYTVLPNEQFEELRSELKGLSAGKPKKQWKSPYEINRMKVG